MVLRAGFVVLMVAGSLAGCAGSTVSPTVMSSPSQETFPTSSVARAPDEYRIGPLDELSITVFEEPDLSLEEVPVDAGGNIQFPLIGLVEAGGKTTREVSVLIAQRLAEQYLIDPQVLVNVSKSSSQIVTVEGQVTRPGRFEVTGQSTLLTAIASAAGPTLKARTDEVLVFRTINGERFAAKFDLRAIRDGRAEDPLIRGNDIVVVGASSAKGLYQDILTALPGLGTIFIALEQAASN